MIPPTDGLLPLAETMLDWTSTAYVLWDDLSPDATHSVASRSRWRIGFDSVARSSSTVPTRRTAIAKTRLVDVMPLRPIGNIELDTEAAAKLLKNWAVTTDRSTEQQIALLQSRSGRIAVDGTLSPEADEVAGCANLLLARRVGRGRVVQSRFDMTSDWLSSWESFHSFINAAVLLRPRREFVDLEDVMNDTFASQRYADSKLKRALPAMNTRFRIAARDSILVAAPAADGEQASSSDVQARTVKPQVDFFDSFSRSDVVSGIAAWTDSSDTLRAARGVLIDEAGIEIPKSSLIAKSLAYYLILLVPVNYLVFRLLGRLEFAWLAVPVIAIGGALWVARLARLDIGFARSQTEIAVLELHAGYPRGHLSRMVAIYNSLSSRYDLAFKTMDAAALPVYASREDASVGETVFETSFAEGPSLAGVAVASGRTQHVHAEQIIEMGGAISRTGDAIENGTAHEFFDVFVVEKGVDAPVRIANVGSIAPGGSVSLRFRNLASAPIADDLPMQTSGLLRKLASPNSMPPGSSRLVGRIDGSLPGMTITPASNQSSGQTLVLAHLQMAPLPRPRPDVNLIADLRPVNKLDDDKD